MIKKKVITVSLLVFFGLFAFLFFAGDEGLVTYFQTNRKIAMLEKQIAQYKCDIDSLERETKRLLNDTAYIEKIAREKYGMARSDETMYKFIEEK